MTRTLLLTLAAAAALAGCKQENHNIVAGEPLDDTANQIANAPPVELPPAIAATKTYRCKDNSIVHIDWLADNQTANIRTGDGPATQLKAPAAGETMVAEGYALSGSATASSVTLTRPGTGAETCKA